MSHDDPVPLPIDVEEGMRTTDLGFDAVEGASPWKDEGRSGGSGDGKIGVHGRAALRR